MSNEASTAVVVVSKYAHANASQPADGRTIEGTVPVYADDAHEGAEVTVSCGEGPLQVLDWDDVPEDRRAAVLAALREEQEDLASYMFDSMLPDWA